jgi:iron(III) transport system ATP-binding protein
MVANEGVVLFDEPLSNLDAKVREHLRLELLELHRDIGFSGLYVTHDQTEATALGHRIAVMNVGTVAQVGSPADIYHKPSSRYVAQFVGSANEVAGVVEKGDGQYCQVETAVGRLAARAGGDSSPAAGQQVTVLFRPEHCRIVPGPAAGGNQLAARLERTMFLGSHVEHVVVVGGTRLVLRGADGETLQVGSDLTVHVDPDRAHVFAVE